MVAFFVVIVVGMFYVKASGLPLISPTLGLGFLGGGFVTLATARLYMRTKLTEDDKNGQPREQDTDK